jgi:hypothetical protein
MISAQGAKSAARTQAQSAKDASAAQLQAAEESIAAQQQAQEAAQANQQPWINAGSSALTQLGNLLGVPIQASGQYASAATSQGGGGGVSGAAGGQQQPSALLSTAGGITGPNPQLYASNPQYKAAWDEVARANKAQGGTANISVADASPAQMAMLTRELTDSIRNAGGNPEQLAASQFQPGTVYGGATGGFSGATGQADPNSFGGQAKQRLSDLMGFNGADPTAALRATPGYQFALQQGLQGIENSAAARGMQLSGATLKDLNDYAQGRADTTYQQQLGNAQSVYNNDVSNLMQMAGLGSGAAGTASGNTIATGSNIGSTLTNTGAQIGSNIIGAGNATAAGQVGASNAIGSGLSSAGQMYQLSQLFGNNQGFGTPSTAGLYGASAGIPDVTPAGSNAYGFTMTGA